MGRKSHAQGPEKVINFELVHHAIFLTKLIVGSFECNSISVVIINHSLEMDFLCLRPLLLIKSPLLYSVGL